MSNGESIVADSRQDTIDSVDDLSFDFEKLYLNASLDKTLIDSLEKSLEKIEGLFYSKC